MMKTEIFMDKHFFKIIIYLPVCFSDFIEDIYFQFQSQINNKQ